jgi:hypothetical protein
MVVVSDCISDVGNCGFCLGWKYRVSRGFWGVGRMVMFSWGFGLSDVIYVFLWL